MPHLNEVRAFAAEQRRGISARIERIVERDHVSH